MDLLALGGMYRTVRNIFVNSRGRYKGRRLTDSISMLLLQSVDLIVMSLHHWSLIYSITPPPLDLLVSPLLSSLMGVKFAMSMELSGMSSFS